VDNLGNDIVSHTILVTGSTGYLGKCIVKKIKQEDIQVISIARGSKNKNIEACDLTKKNEIKELIERFSPSRIIHCAASVPKEIEGEVSGYQDSYAADDSLQMALNIAEISTCPIVFTSSMTVYDCESLLDSPIYEGQDICRPKTLYAARKLSAEKGMARLTNNGLVNLRLPGLFGKPRTTGVLYKAAYAFLSGVEFNLTSTPLWAAMHVDDAADNCIKAAKLNFFPKNETINIGYSNIFNIIDSIKLLADICNVSWNCNSLVAPYFQADLKKSKKYGLSQEDCYKDRLEQLVLNVHSDMANNKDGSR